MDLTHEQENEESVKEIVRQVSQRCLATTSIDEHTVRK